MNLGERIYTLRTKKNLSQGDLAELLNVSRQSVSKWENNSAVPDLEKIVRLSEVFGITVDELVKGEDGANAQQSTETTQTPPPAPTVQIVKEPMEKRVLAGIILLCLGGLAALLLLVLTGWGCVYALPVLGCGVICMIAKKDTGFYCAWFLYVIAALFLPMATAVPSWKQIRYTFQWTQSMNYAILLIAWVWFALLVALLLTGMFKFAKRPGNRKKTIAAIIVSAVYLVSDFVGGKLLNNYMYQLLQDAESSLAVSGGFQVVFAVMNLLETVALAVLTAQAAKLVYGHFIGKRAVSC